MTPLSAEQVDRFQADLRAAWLAGVPLYLSGGGQRADESTLEHLGRLARRGVSAGALHTADVSPAAPVRYRAALLVWASTGQMPLVLDALTAQRQVERAVSRALRATVIYLLLLLAVGYAGLVLYTSFTAPRIDALQHNLRLTPQAVERAAYELTPTLATILWIIPVATVAIVGATWWLGGMTMVARWFGARHYRISAMAATAARVAAALAERGVPVAEANEWACDAVAGDTKTRGPIARQLNEYGRRTESGMGLSTRADQFRLVAAQRLLVIKLVAPVVLILLIGGAIALLFAMLVYWPVVDLYHDIASIGRVSGGAP